MSVTTAVEKKEWPTQRRNKSVVEAMSLSGAERPSDAHVPDQQGDRVDDLGRDEHQEQQHHEHDRPTCPGAGPARCRRASRRTVAIRAAPSAAFIDVMIALRIDGLSGSVAYGSVPEVLPGVSARPLVERVDHDDQDRQEQEDVNQRCPRR